MNFPEVRSIGGVGMGAAGLPPTHTPTTPNPAATDPSPPTPPPVSLPEASPYLSFPSIPGLSSPPAVSHPSIASMWGIGGFTTPPMPTPPPVVCPNTIASTLGIPQMPNVTYFNSRAPMGFNRMAGSLNGVPYVFKRKPEEEPEEIKPLAKQHISEERMTAHLNSLHLSDSYCNHRLGKAKGQRKGGTEEEGVGDLDVDEGLGGDGVISLDGSPNLSTQQRGPRLVIADEVKRIVPGENKLPESILKRLTQPSMEVVLWQPPTNILSINHQMKTYTTTASTTCSTSTSSSSSITISSNTTTSTSSPSSSSSSPDSGISITSPPPQDFVGGNSMSSPLMSLNEAAAATRTGGPHVFPGPNDAGLTHSPGASGSCYAPSSEVALDLLSLPSTSSGSRGSGFLPLPLRRPASPLPDPMVDDDFFERMEFNNNNGNAPNFMWLEENNNTALLDLNAVEPQRAAAPAQPQPPQPPLPEDLPDFPDSDDMDL